MVMTKRPVRPIRIEGDVAFITLTRGFEAKIDAADIPLVSDTNWTVFTPTGRSNIYAMRREDKSFGPDYRALMHRLIMGFPAMQVDHINGDGLDNRRCNLRCVTHSQNQMNRKGPARNGTSGHRGVSLNKRTGKWFAYIHSGGKHVHLGSFSEKTDAISARAEAAAKIYGGFSR